MTQEVRRRFHRTLNFQANSKVTENLSRGMIYRALMLNLAGTVTTSAGGDNDAADVKPPAEWGVIERIDVIANGSDVLKSISGESLWWHNYFWFGGVPQQSAAIGGGGDDPAFDSTLILPFWMPRAVRPFDTALDARRLSQLQIDVTWGDQNDILRPAGASAFTVAPTLDVFGLESFNPPQGSAFSQWQITQMQETITATNTAFRLELPVGHMYRKFIINTQNGADVNNLADVATVINRVKLKSGTTVYADLTEEVLQHEYPTVNGCQNPVARNSSVSSRNGWYALDLVTDGRLPEAVDTLGFAELELEFDLTHPGNLTNLRVWPSRIIPVRG